MYNVEAIDHLKVQQRDRDQSSSTEAYQEASQPNINLDLIKNQLLLLRKNLGRMGLSHARLQVPRVLYIRMTD